MSSKTYPTELELEQRLIWFDHNFAEERMIRMHGTTSGIIANELYRYRTVVKNVGRWIDR